MVKGIEDYSKLPNFERKTFSAAVKSFDEAQGIVDQYVAIIGNEDMGDDEIVPGAFAKTIQERGLNVKVLDQHDTSSVTCIIGKPLQLREVGRNELSPEVLAKAPNAKGALLATTQYALDTTRGRDVFNLVKGGFATEASIGYDPTEVEYVHRAQPDGSQKKIRLLKQVRLWEYSNVIFGMNPATSVLSAKSAPGDEAKPWNAFQEGGKWRVYKVDAEGKPTGDALGEFDTEEEARAQVRALYANEPGAGKDTVVTIDMKELTEDAHRQLLILLSEVKGVTRSEADGDHPASHYLVVEDPQEPSKWHLRVRDASGKPDHNLMGAAWAALTDPQGHRGNRYEGPGKQEAIRKLRALYAAEDMTPPGDEGKADDAPDETKAGRRVNADRIAKLKAAREAIDEWLKWAEYGDEGAPPPEAAPDDSQKSQAGPADMPPTTMDIMALELELSQRIVEG